MKEMYNHMVKAGKGKPVIITETGWPSAGSNLDAAQPSYENYLRYFIAAQLWSLEEKSICFISQVLMSLGVGDEGM